LEAIEGRTNIANMRPYHLNISYITHFGRGKTLP
jgi:hypothetical protein